jgi:hypothetical protein
VKTAQQAAANYTASAGRAQADWLAGIQGTSKDQAALAVAAGARYIQGVQEAYSSGRWAAGLNRRGTGYWKSQSEKKQSSYGTGITAGSGNYANAAAKLLPAIQNIVQSLPARGDINQNLQRSAGLALALHSQKGSFKAS